MTAPLVVITGASFEYPTVTALQEVDLEIEAGGLVGIVGPSGSGKTTLLRLIAGSADPTSGSVMRSPGLRVGYVPQVDSISWDFPATCLEVLLMASAASWWRPWGEAQDRARAVQLLDQLHLEEMATRSVRALSGGQRQRVFIARALMNTPDLLLLDEPTSDVDVATRHEILHLLHDLNHGHGISVVITTHDLNGIASHMHTLVCLNRRVVATGAPTDVMTPRILEETYGAPMDVLTHGGMPVAVEPAGDGEAAWAAHHEH